MRVYYHIFTSKDESPSYSNLRVPTLLSIATLRAVNPSIKITVLDGSEESDWGTFKKNLDFEVRPIEFCLKERWQHIQGWQHLSRIFDLNRHADVDDVIYCDSDVFWLKDPLPLACDPEKFCFDGYNTGYFYFDLRSPYMDSFFEIFEAYTISAMADKKIREILKSYVGYDAWYDVWDEMITTFMVASHEELFNFMPPEEHSTARRLVGYTKMFHCNGTMMSNYFPKRKGERLHSRGLLCLVIKEFYDNICKVLDVDDLNLIFTPDEIKFYIPQQFSLFNRARLQHSKIEDGHYHINRVLRPPTII